MGYNISAGHGNERPKYPFRVKKRLTSTVGKVIGDFDGFFVGEVDGEEVDMVFSEGVVDGCTVVVN